MAEEEQNIFLRAAMSGKIILPTKDSNLSKAFDATIQPQRPKAVVKPKGRKTERYSDVEDMMILQAVESNGRDWRSVLRFLKEHWAVLGKKNTKYKNVDENDKKAQDRVRKRASKLLKEPGKHAESKQKMAVHDIDKEYCSSSEASNDTDPDIRKEVRELTARINERDDRYVLEASGPSSTTIDHETVLDTIARKRRKEKEEDENRNSKRPKTKKSRPTREDKMDRLLGQMPDLIQTTTEAAQKHINALKKWEKKHGIESESSDEQDSTI